MSTVVSCPECQRQLKIAPAAVGKSGKAGTRFGAATASARNCPARTGAADEPRPSNTTGT